MLFCLQIANSILNSPELDLAVAHLMIAARSDGYAQGYAECAAHVSHAFNKSWGTSRASTHGVDTTDAYKKAKEAYEQLSIPILASIEGALPHEDFVEQLKAIFAGATQEPSIGRTPK